MRFSVITPNYNGARFLETSILSVLQQESSGLELEYIIVDGNSTDASHEILKKYADRIDHIIIENDSGPANAINKGLSLATGDIFSWLNADDIYFPGTLSRVRTAFGGTPEAVFCFGPCPIIDQNAREIRKGITRFKEFFFKFSNRFTHQCINYVSQPSVFMRSKAINRIGRLRVDMIAAWDYEYFLRLWHLGPAIQIKGHPISAFRWTENSISGQNFYVQFKEEYEAVKKDAGMLSPQNAIYFMVRWGISAAYAGMACYRRAMGPGN